MKEKPIPQNKFEVIASRVMQCGVRKEVRRQEKEEKEVQCFRYWGIGHYKQECPNIKVEKERRRSKEVAYVVSPQKAQQEEKPVHSIQRKTQEYSSTWGMLLKSVVLEEKGWKIRQEVVTFIEFGGCDYKGTKTKENQGQNFISRGKLRNIWCKSCLEVWKWRNKETGSKVKYTQCRRKDTIVEEKISKEERRNIWCLECRTERKQPWWNWGVAAHSKQRKIQQSGIQTEAPKGRAREGGEQKEVRRTFKMLREVQLNIGVEKIDIYKGMTVKALLDSGIMGMFMDQKIAVRHGLRLQKLERLIVVRNINGTNNSAEAIIHQVEINIYYKGHVERMRIDVCNLERTDMILEILWLQAHNPEINWKTGEVKMTRCPLLCGRNTKLKEEKRAKKRKRITTLEEEKIVKWAVDNKEDWEREEEVEVDYRKIKDIVLQKFLKWRKVFGKVESERMLTRKIWDHTIDLKKTFKPRKERIYPLSRNKREEVQNFIEDQLKKGYIRPSKSSQILLVFFVSKKDRGKKIVINYCNLNDQTVKNNYLLPLIMDLIDNMGSKQVFTKMDLWLGFNNMRIKKGNEWKKAFITYVGSFEPTVMFFGITNLPAIFQAMINEILRDIINEGKVVAFVDNILVEIEIEEGHNKIMEEVLKRLEENNLYVKPEKCMWKVQKIGFLGVVIGPNGIKMEKEKVDEVLSWPEPKNIKDVRKFLGLANYYRRFIRDFA